MAYMEVTPAYGRDYKNQADVKKDWKDGKDFILQDVGSRWDGKPLNKDSIPAGTHVIVRYAGLRKTVQVC